jgi:enoyl-CoA hydratase/carnithine racemase
VNGYRNWEVEIQGHAATLALNRPQHQNSLNLETLQELRDVVCAIRDRTDIWVVVLEGRGRHFSAGIDLAVIEVQLCRPKDDLRSLLQEMQVCLDELETLSKPTIAKLKGFCIGGGLIMALCCDLRIASERTVFSLPEVRLGMGIIWGTKRVTRTVGIPAAKEMILLGGRYRASQALAMGLVTRVVEPAALDTEVASLVAKFEYLPPRTIGVAKRIIDATHTWSLPESQALEVDLHCELLDSPDLREAVISYRDRRRPNFCGN